MARLASGAGISSKPKNSSNLGAKANASALYNNNSAYTRGVNAKLNADAKAGRSTSGLSAHKAGLQEAGLS
jgi:hypothetical protein